MLSQKYHLLPPIPASTAAIIVCLGLSNGTAAQTSDVQAGPLGEFGCQFHANDYFANSADSENNDELSEYMSLMSEALELENELIQLDRTNNAWTEERATILLGLAKAQRIVGDEQEARTLYEDALLNMRVNRGVYSLDQVPVILDLMAWYMASDPEYTDELADRVAFLYDKRYLDDEEIPELVAGYSQLLQLRRQANEASEGRSSSHQRRISELGVKIANLIYKLFNSVDPAVQAQLRGEVEFFTRYDDLGNPISSREPGMAQVSYSTGIVLEEVQLLLQSTDADRQSDLAQAKQRLDGLNRNFAALSSVDRSALLDFYGDYFLAEGDIPSAISAYEGILAIKVLRPDYQLRALRAVGQLYEERERWTDAVSTFSCWQRLSSRNDARVALGLANAHRQLSNHESSIRHLLTYMEILEDEGSQADETVYAVLKDMYYEVEDFESVAKVTQQMAELFD
ncbi:MAG: hypothetical protein MI746_01340 [Pseudomonadales bacterium]|nr:hypothetical protein [Pseudomonadales bacterium]